MEILKAVIYGIIEGITEWLPISSTGHMILAEQLLKFDLSPEFMTMFRVVIQVGAVLAVVVLFWHKLWPFCRDNGKDQGFASHIKWPALRLWFKIIVATLPALVLGFLLDDWFDAHFYNYFTVAVTLILYGVLFLVVERRERDIHVRRLGQITYKDALIVGFWQVLAMIPGTSRSGATIIGGLLLGIERGVTAQFTFFLAIPVMLGASVLKVIKYLAAGGVFTAMELGVMLAGCLVAFVVSLVVIRALMNFVKTHSFRVFGWYRIALGLVVLGVALVNLTMGAAA